MSARPFGSAQDRRGAGLPRRAAILLVRLYQATLSPLIGRQCRFQPTCSNYFIEALERNGLFRGTLLGLRRILRCHPLARGGYDPVDAPARSGAKGAGETAGRGQVRRRVFRRRVFRRRSRPRG